MLVSQDLPRGTVELLEVESKALKDNPLGDPRIRRIPVYLPHGYKKGDDYPLIFEMASYCNSGLGRLNWDGFKETLPARLDRLMANGEMLPAVVAMPDCYTRFGGNQYVNGGMGDYADFINKEVLPLVESVYQCGGKGRRGITGRSSGGYAAIIYGMLYSDVWSAIACHAGDMAFDLTNVDMIPGVANTLEKYGNDLSAFVDDVISANKVSGSQVMALMFLGLCVTYDPDPSQPLSLRLPFDPSTLQLIPERWENWLKWDPVQMINDQAVQKSLKSLKHLYIDCGDQDQYLLHYGSRRLVNAMKEKGIPHEYEEFPDNHSGTDYRYDISLPKMTQVLAC